MATDLAFLARARGRIPPKTAARLLELLALVVTLCASAKWLGRALPRFLPRDWATAHDFDALVDWKAARLFLHGLSPFSRAGLAELNVQQFGHPPTAPFWFIPLGGFDKALAAELMSLSVCVCLVVHVAICLKELRFPAPVVLTILLSSAFFATDAMFIHFIFIQLSEYIALAYVIAWRKLRRGEDFGAGMAVGVGITLKLFPGLAALLFLVGRKWKAFAGACVMFLAVALVMASTFGIRAWPRFFKMQDDVLAFWLGHVRNASLQGIVHRWFSPICEGHVPPNRVAIQTAAALALVLIVSGFVLSWPDLVRARKEDPKAIDMPFALFSALSAFLTAWVWEHYVLILILPGFLVFSRLFGSFRTTLRAWLDERVTLKALAIESLAFGVGLSGFAVIAKAVSLNAAGAEQLFDLWNSRKDPSVHYLLHYYEVAKYAPWLVMIALCFFCLARARLAERAERRARTVTTPI